MLKSKLQRVGSNVAWLVANRVITKGAGLLVIGFAARVLGEERYGILSYALLLVGMFHAVANMGLDGIVIRELVKAPHRSSEILGSSLALRLLGATLATSLVGSVAALDPANQGLMPVFLLVGSLFFPQAFEVADLWFQKNIDSKFPVIARTVAVVLGASVKCLLLINHAPLVAFAGACLLEGVLNAAAVLIVYRLRGQHPTAWRFNAPLARAMLRDSWPLILSGLLIALYMRLEQVMVRSFLGYKSLGIYNTASQITEAWGFLPAFLLSSIYPVLVEERQRSPERFQKRMQLVFDLLTGLGYAVALGVATLAPILIPALFGDRYLNAIPVLVIQSLGAPIFFSGAVRAQFFLFENINIYHTLTASLGIALNITLAILLIPILGLPGAAVAGFFGALLAGFGSSWLFKPLRPCARWQLNSFLLPFRLRSVLREFRGLHEN